MAECLKNQNQNACKCTYEPCSRKGACCQCISYHLAMRELPGCCFTKEAEASYDRSFDHFVRLVQSGKM